jgi:3-deoxy-D-manno-octulosonic-acid transferase
MLFLYSIVLTLGFIILLPRFIVDAIFKGKYAAGFKQRLGFLPKFDSHGRRVVWLHCVSVGEANAALPLAKKIKSEFPRVSLVVSTTTKTGQAVARRAYADIADLVFYFPFDWRWTVRRALRRINPSVVLLTETELWFNFIRESYKHNARVCTVNGRLSERSFVGYSRIRRFMKRMLGYLDLALMQTNADATRLMSLGARASKVKVTGNLKFDHDASAGESGLTAEFRERFGITPEAPLIIAASTHEPEEKWVLAAFDTVVKSSGKNPPRLLIAPRHPERFDRVADAIRNMDFCYVRRSESPSELDRTAEVILLDSIGELRAAYPLAEVVFVGGSLIAHGGQSVFEPAAAGKAIVTGPHTSNFDEAVKEFVENKALVQLDVDGEDSISKIAAEFSRLLGAPSERQRLGRNALTIMKQRGGAVSKSLDYLRPLLETR